MVNAIGRKRVLSSSASVRPITAAAGVPSVVQFADDGGRLQVAVTQWPPMGEG
jgi:hypothetical protein